MPGRCLKGSELLAQSSLAELASHERSLHPNAALYVLEDQPITMRPNHDTKTAADAVHIIPAPCPGRLKSRPEVFPGPARKAVDAMVSFAVRGPLWDVLAVARS